MLHIVKVILSIKSDGEPIFQIINNGKVSEFTDIQLLNSELRKIHNEFLMNKLNIRYCLMHDTVEVNAYAVLDMLINDINHILSQSAAPPSGLSM